MDQFNVTSRVTFCLIGCACAVVALFAMGYDHPALADAAHGHPARLQEGTCDALGAVAFPLNGAGATLTIDGSTPAPTVVGASTAVGVEVSVTVIDAALTDIVAGNHAVAVYLSDEAMETVIACGDVGGPMLGESLIVGLRTEGESGSAGMAIFAPTGDQATVTILLGDGITGEAGGDQADDGHTEDEHTEDEHGHESEATPES